MVTKRFPQCSVFDRRYILAKNHMVTKPARIMVQCLISYILAKNHMVTKRVSDAGTWYFRYILAKNHMVTKLS